MEMYYDTVTDTSGNIINGATVTVYYAVGGVATIYDKDGSPQANPFLSGLNRSEGEVEFAAANGLYDIKVVNGAETDWKYDVSLFDASDIELVIHDTVAAMKADTGLIVNQVVKTRGYYAIDDEGGAEYVIKANQAVDGYGDHLLTNGLTAFLIDVGDAVVNRFGAIGNDSIDCSAALTACSDHCVTNGKTLVFMSGVYKVLTTPNIRCSTRGNGPTASIIKNYGTGAGVDLSNSAYYYATHTGWSVDGSGNASSGNGIVLYTASPDNPAYCHFDNVYSYSNGGHGLYHRYAWGTRYSKCKFYSNAGLGVHIDTQTGDAGGANCVTFMQCDSRHNGGTSTGFGTDAGGIKVTGSSVVLWIGGIIESNCGYGVYVGGAPGTPATRLVHFWGTYFELNGWGVADGAVLYATGPWANITFEGCWIHYGAESVGQNNTCFFLGTSSDGGNFVERNNNYSTTGSGTIARYGGTHLSSTRSASGTAPTVRVSQDPAYTLQVPTATATKIQMSIEAWDSNADFDAGITNTFKPTVAGYYHVSSAADYFPAGGSNFFISIYKNGAEDTRGPAIDTTPLSGISAQVDGLVYCNGSTDYIDIYVYQTSGSTQNYNPSAGLCRMSAHFVRSP